MKWVICLPSVVDVKEAAMFWLPNEKSLRDPKYLFVTFKYVRNLL